MVAPEEAAVAADPGRCQVAQEMFLTQVQALQDYKATTADMGRDLLPMEGL